MTAVQRTAERRGNMRRGTADVRAVAEAGDDHLLRESRLAITTAAGVTTYASPLGRMARSQTPSATSTSRASNAAGMAPDRMSAVSDRASPVTIGSPRP